MTEPENRQPATAHPMAPHYRPVAEDEIDLVELFKILWAGKWVIVGITAAAAVISVIVALVMTEIYRAEATLAPATSRESGSPLASQLGGAAAFIGINLPTSEDGGRVNNAMAIMRSRDFIIRFIRENEVLVPLFAGRYDRAEKTSVVDPSMYDESSGKWLSEDGSPTDLQAYRAFRDIFSLSQDRDTGLVTLAVEWHDPVVATRWVNSLVQRINQEVKAADQAEADNAIAYLRRQLESTQLVEMQRVFYDLIESQTRVSMLADVREEYVFQVVDPAMVPDQKIAPRRSLIAVLGTLLGGMLAVLGVLITHYVRAGSAVGQGSSSPARADSGRPPSDRRSD
jgi:uncharacterized protein involved in exopolysaccharide biosynthesis